MKNQNLAIMYNSVEGDVPCAICGGEGKAMVGFEVCLADSKQIVCQDCAERHDPALAEQFGCLMSLKRHKEHTDRVLPWLSQALENVGVLGTVLRFNEKKDISYVGEMLADAAEMMQEELKQFGPWPNIYAPEAELPF